MPIVAGIDSSPSTTRVVVCDALSGRILRRAAVSHAAADDPHEWWNALVSACGDGILDGVQAISVAGQRQALVAVDASGTVIRPALMASDHRAATSADDLVTEGGGIAAWASAVGSVPTASSPIAKLRWLAMREPENAARVAAVMQPHDWLTWLLLDGATPPVTDRGDASGTGYWSPTSGEYRATLLGHAFGRELGLPRVLGPTEPAGHTGAGILVAPGTGAAMAAVLGLDAGAGDVVLSIGASGTLFAGGLEQPVIDPTGTVSGFADATGRHLAMMRTGEAMPLLDAAATMLGTDLEGLSRLALESTPGAQGLVLLPPQVGLPGSLTGLRLARMTPSNLARAAVEGLLCGLAEGLAALAAHLAATGTPVRRVILTGRGARLDALRLIAPAILGVPVCVALEGVNSVPTGGLDESMVMTIPAGVLAGPPPGGSGAGAGAGGAAGSGSVAGSGSGSGYGGSEIMAIGAARQAAWTLAASSAPNGETPAHPPTWTEAVTFRNSPTAKPGIGDGIRAQYAGAREAALAAFLPSDPIFASASLSASGVMTVPEGLIPRQSTPHQPPQPAPQASPQPAQPPSPHPSYQPAPSFQPSPSYDAPYDPQASLTDDDPWDEDYQGRRRR